MWLVPVWSDERPGPARRVRRLLRALVVAGPWWLLVSAGTVDALPEGTADGLVAAGWTLAALAVVVAAVTRRGLSGVLTGARVVDSRSPDAR